MSKVKGRRQPPTSRRRKAAPPPPEPQVSSVDASSIVFGLVMVLAVIVAGAALMGGSMSKMNKGVSGTVDGFATRLGFSVADVRIVGLARDPQRAELVAKMSEVEPGDNMFRADPQRIRRRVLSTGQVTDARVYRLWPNQILIHASPARAAALWHDGTDWQVVDSLGRIMEGMKAEDHADLVRLSGADAPEGVPALLKVLGQLDQIGADLSYAERVSQRRWDLRLRSGLLIQLPPDHGAQRAADDLARLEHASQITDRPLARIDLRVPGRTFLKPGPEAGAPGASAES